MTGELAGVIVGGVIGILGGLSTTVLTTYLANRKRAKAIRAIAEGEVTAIKEKAERYINDQSTTVELGASSPLLASIASELGFLTVDQVVALRRAVTLDTEMREQGSKKKAKLAVAACEEALRTLVR